MPLWKKKKAAEPAAPLDVLRWKIVAVNILFAAMVVATLCFVAARQGKNALEEKHRLAFASLCSALEQPILETQTIDHNSWQGGKSKESHQRDTGGLRKGRT